MSTKTNMKNENNQKELKKLNKRVGIVRNVLTVLNIILLIAAIVLAVMILTGCSKEPERYPEAEALVAEKLDEVKNADLSSDVIARLANEEVAGQYDGSMVEGYLNKLKDFDYEIVGSSKTESDDKDEVAVRVKITTYEFGNEYLKAWNEHMQLDEEDRWQSQFYSFLLLRLASVTNKDYVSEVDVICTEEDGEWKTDLKDNEDLMNALSGGMLKEIENLVGDDVIMDNTEIED